MFCPNCSERKANDATQFCKRCGLDLFGLSEFVERGERCQPFSQTDRPRNWMRQGITLFAIGLMLIPVWMYIATIFPANDRLVESASSTTPFETLAWIGMWMAFIVGSIRIGYSLIVENKKAGQRSSIAESKMRSGVLPAAVRFGPAR